MKSRICGSRAWDSYGSIEIGEEKTKRVQEKQGKTERKERKNEKRNESK